MGYIAHFVSPLVSKLQKQGVYLVTTITSELSLVWCMYLVIISSQKIKCLKSRQLSSTCLACHISHYFLMQKYDYEKC